MTCFTTLALCQVTRHNGVNKGGVKGTNPNPEKGNIMKYSDAITLRGTELNMKRSDGSYDDELVNWDEPTSTAVLPQLYDLISS